MKISDMVLCEFNQADVEDMFIYDLMWDEFKEQFRECIKDKLKTGYIKVKSINRGWNAINSISYIDIDTENPERTLLDVIVPHGVSEYDITVHSIYNNRGIYINIKHHDNPVNGDKHYCTNITENTYNRMRGR